MPYRYVAETLADASKGGLSKVAFVSEPARYIRLSDRRASGRLMIMSRPEAGGPEDHERAVQTASS